MDRIVSIGAFEAFKVERYPLFFEKAYNILPDDGRMLLHTILAHTQKFFRDNGIKVTISDLKFMRFIEAEIFPGGRLPAVEDIEKLAADSGFTLERTHLLQPHYARTLDMWAENLEKSRDEAIAVTSPGGLRPLHEVPRSAAPTSSTAASPTWVSSPSPNSGVPTGSRQALASFCFSASISKSAGGQDKFIDVSDSISSSVTASRLYHFLSHGTTCHGA